ncbi:MAG: hypothetical protein QOE86_3288 [Solirubrobacteraceae bacterium]|nr:hypothetical protein [Solirubrobacteraceae bacterium]
MTPQSLLSLFRKDAERLAAVAAGALAAPVPSCPGWSAGDLTEHVAMVYLHKIAAIRDQKQPDPWPPELGDIDPLTLFGEAYQELSALFDAHLPGDPAWTWTADRTVGFWIRRMAHETAVHRVDAELAAGDRTPIDPELATDGVDEMLAVILPAIQATWPDELRSALGDAAGEVLSVRTGGREWRVGFGETGVNFSPSAEPSAIVDGPAENVLLWLWNRAGDSDVTITGSPRTAEVARRALTAASQ